MDSGRVFIHEHPRSATSWALKEVKKIMDQAGVSVYQADQCMYGLKTKSCRQGSEMAAKKPTKFMINSRALGQELSRIYDGMHKQQSLVDGRARLAARYPTGLCKAICRGIIKEKMERARGIRAVGEIDCQSLRRCGFPAGRGTRLSMDLEASHVRSETEITLMPLKTLVHAKPHQRSTTEALAWDDLTGMRLDAGQVIEATGKEMDYVHKMRVWKRIPRKTAQARGWKVIQTLWIDTNK